MHTWIEISKSALLYNIKHIKSLLSPQCKFIAVLKANAYGHGLLEVGECVQDEVDLIAVTTDQDARRLREHGISRAILILGYYPLEKDFLQWAVKERVELAVFDLEQAEKISRLLSEGEARIHFKIDTGMGRLGTYYPDAAEEIKEAAELPHIYLKGVYSHYADGVDHNDYTLAQTERFAAIRKDLQKQGLGEELYHLAKSSTALTFPDSQQDGVRIGIAMYGLWGDKKIQRRVKMEYPDFELKPVLRWAAKILQVKDYPADTALGYGCSFKTKRRTRVAILPIGYYDGYDRKLSNRGQVLIRGERANLVGRVCMNMIMIDATDIKDAKAGDEAVLIGAQGRSEIKVEELSEIVETINHEIVSRLNPEIKRVAVE